jgi:hypothetical protein
MNGRRPKRLRRLELKLKYRFRGMAKTNFRKHGRRKRFQREDGVF